MESDPRRVGAGVKIYFAGSESAPYDRALLAAGAHNRLKSYWYIKNNLSAHSPLIWDSFFLDSGAFTAWTQGEEISIQSYVEAVRELNPHVYATLDVIGDFEATKKNTKIIESQGLRPLPAFHYGCREDEIRYWLSHYDYVALGGLVPHARSRQKLRAWLDYVFSIIKKDYWPIKTHLFGITTEWVLKRYPAYSADSSSWLQSARYGSASKRGECEKVTSFRNKKVHYLERVQTTVRETLALEADVTKIWKQRGVVWDETNKS